ncbi:MAG TPA: hypothetical protein ENG00_00185 [Candidatus Aenigmarchaeota archaeon]|nr:hypothetical protein [Candidatus Aenigmarchaeota archaeon]
MLREVNKYFEDLDSSSLKYNKKIIKIDAERFFTNKELEGMFADILEKHGYKWKSFEDFYDLKFSAEKEKRRVNMVVSNFTDTESSIIYVDITAETCTEKMRIREKTRDSVLKSLNSIM